MTYLKVEKRGLSTFLRLFLTAAILSAVVACEDKCNPDPPQAKWWSIIMHNLPQASAMSVHGGKVYVGGNVGRVEVIDTTALSGGPFGITAQNYTGSSTPYQHSVTAIGFNSAGDVFVGVSGNGIFKYDGANWHDSVLAPTDVREIVTNTQGDMFAASSAGIWRSTDGGSSWAQVGGPEVNNKIFQALVVSGVTGWIYAGGQFGVLRSTDNGNTWADISGGQVWNVVDLGASTTTSAVYALTADKLFTANAGGGQWSMAPLPASAQNTCLAVRPPEQFYVGSVTQGITYQQTSGSIKWDADKNSSGLNASSVLTCVYNSANGKVYAGTNSGVYREG